MSPGHSLDDPPAADVRLSGAKAARLAQLRARGLPVPPGWVVGTGDDPRAGAAAAADHLPGDRWAVRSSSPEEDGGTRSRAGRFASEVGVSGDGLAAAISRVRTGVDGPIPVLVMPSLRASWAGVAFTTDPVDGSDTVVVEAVTDDTTAVTAGSVAPLRVRLFPDGTASGDVEALDPALVHRVAALAREVAAASELPQDLEWAEVGGTVWLVQARPVTARQCPVPVAVPPGQRWELSRDHRWRPPYLLEHTAWAPVLDRSMRQALAAVGAPVETLEQRLIGGWAYHRITPLGDAGRDDAAPPPAWLMAVLSRVVPSLRRRLATAARAPEAAAGVAEEWERHGRTQLRSEAGRLLAVGPTGLAVLDDAGLARHLERVLAHLQDASDAHTDLPVRASWLQVGLLGAWCQAHLGWDAATTLAALDRARPPLPDRPAPGIPAAADRRALGLDLATPAAAPDPTPSRPMTVGARRRGAADPASPELPEGLGPDQAAEYAGLLRRAAAVAHYGDETEADVLVAVGLLRDAAHEVGRRLTGRGRLDRPEEVLHLTVAELPRALTDPVPRAEVERRAAEHRWALAHPGPPAYGPAPAPPGELRGLPRAAAATWSALLWSVAAAGTAPASPDHDGPDHDGPDHDGQNHDGPATEAGRVRGVGASAGRWRGTARVVRGAADFGRVRSGDVVVCDTTLASWEPLFGIAGALVAETGGVLSHPAILAREHGLPAVVSASGVLDLVVEGDTVTVDGTAGTVTVESPGPQAGPAQ